MNGDGYDDVVVSATYYDDGETNEGKVSVYLGSAEGLSGTAAWTAESDQPSAQLGFSLDGAGDVDGDGYDDVIVGAYSHTNGEFDEGGAWLYRGIATGLEPTSSWSAESDQVGAHYASAVSGAGDVNGDGYTDVVVGADGFDNGEAEEGRVFLYLGYSDDTDGDGLSTEVDCDDADPASFPGAQEIGDDGIDQDCDGSDAAAGTDDTAKVGDPADGGCGCGATGGRSGGPAVIAVMAALGRRRKR